ncbi:MAG: hypothetical protein COT33_01980, partial [Candidatus Nealsonbacteria bacterium CG08_land_8_20_14_0_20_38_20]
NTEGLSIFQAFKKYTSAYRKTVLYLIDNGDFKKTGVLSIFLLAHLSIELYLKSWLLQNQKQIINTHDLKKILSIFPQNFLSEDIKNKILSINEIGISGFGFRYPIDKKGDRYENFRVRFLPELNYLETFQKDKTTVSRDMKQSTTKNYLQLIDDIKFVLDRIE